MNGFCKFNLNKREKMRMNQINDQFKNYVPINILILLNILNIYSEILYLIINRNNNEHES